MKVQIELFKDQINSEQLEKEKYKKWFEELKNLNDLNE